MYDILTALQYGELSDLRGKPPMKPPYTIAENRILSHLQALDSEDALELQRDIRVLAIEQRNAAFQTGVRFGAQLMLQLLNDF